MPRERSRPAGHAERLELLYGDAASFAAGNDPEGGFRVTVRVPLRVREAAA